MFLQRNTASQVFTLPGTLRVIADGSAATSGAALTWIKDGTSSASAGTLTHISDGAYTYAPTQGETDAKICGWVLTKTGAAGIAGSIRTTNADPNAATNLGLTALPTTACTTNASLLTSGTGTDQLSVASGRIDVGKALGTAVTLDANNALNVSTKYIGGTLQTARDLGASVLLSAGTGTGQLDFTSGVVKSNLVQILATALTETAGQIAAGFKKFFNIATPNSTMDHLTLLDTLTTYAGNTPQTGDSFAIVNSGSFGNSALLSAIQNVQNNTFIATSIPYTLERPDSSSTSISISIVFSDETGAAKNLDSGSPTITLVNDGGTDRSGRLGSITNPATGKYIVAYTNTSTDTIEGLHWDITGTINSKLRRMVAYTQIVDTTAVDFTSSDRTNLNSVLSTVNTNLNATVASRMASYTQPTGFLAATFPAAVASSTDAADGPSVIYVDANNGNDAKDGTTWLNAFQTLLGAVSLSNYVANGSIFKLATGTYNVGEFTDATVYTGLTFEGPPDRSAIITGSVSDAGGGVIILKNGWTLRNLTVTNTNVGSPSLTSNTNAIYSNNANDITLENVQAIATGANGIVIQNCKRLRMTDVIASGMYRGIYVLSSDGWIIRPRCTVTNGWPNSLAAEIYDNTDVGDTFTASKRRMMLVENPQWLNEINTVNSTTDTATLIFGADLSGTMSVQVRGGFIMARRLVAPTTGTADCVGLVTSESGRIILSDGVFVQGYSVAPGAGTIDLNTDDSAVTDGHIYAESAEFTSTAGGRQVEFAPTAFNTTANSDIVASKVVTDALATALEADPQHAGKSRLTTPALVNAPAGGGGSGNPKQVTDKQRTIIDRPG